VKSEVTRGDRSVGSLIIQTLPTGQKQTTLTVTGVKGNLGATAVKTVLPSPRIRQLNWSSS
jgi:hypothetical protein